MSYQNPYTTPREKRDSVWYMRGEPLTVKADCKNGVFLPLGEEAFLPDGTPNPAASPVLSMSPVKYGSFPAGVMFPSEAAEAKKHDWTQVFFLDDRGVLCATLLKNESRDNFLNRVRDLEISGGGMTRFVDFKFVARMHRRKSARHKSDYFAADFEAVPLTDAEKTRNAAFAETEHPYVYDLRTVNEYIARNLNVPDAQMPVARAEVLFALGFIPAEVATEITTHKPLLTA